MYEYLSLFIFPYFMFVHVCERESMSMYDVIFCVCTIVLLSNG